MYSISFINNNLELYRLNLSDGSSFIISDNETFSAVNDYLQARADALSYPKSLILSSRPLSVAIANVLGVFLASDLYSR